MNSNSIINVQVLKLYAAVFVVLFSSAILLAGPVSHIMPLPEASLSDAESKQLDLQKFKNLKQLDQKMDPKKVSLIIPTNIPNGSTQEVVSKKILDQSLSSFLSGRLTPDNEVFMKAKELEQSMQYEVSIKPQDSDVSHSFNLQYLPFQQSIKFKYSGYIDANVVFDTYENLDAELAKKISSNAAVVIAHQERNLGTSNAVMDSSSTINMRWSY